MSGLEGQTYVVTGASKGIGRAICLELAKAGATVSLLARQSEALRETTQEVQSISPNSFAVACDLANPDMVAQSATEILSSVSQLDGLVHNAGDIHPIQPLFKADPSQWSRSMMVNLVGVQHLTCLLYTSPSPRD